MAGQKRRVLVLDNDRDIAELVHAVLTDAGFEVSELTDLRSDAIRIAVGQQEPDCVLLDGASSADPVPAWVSVLGEVLVALGLFIDLLVMRENTFSASNVRVEQGQTVISTGPYAIARHPMYAGVVVMVVGVPLALGSWLGLLVLVLTIPVLVLRILDEEKLLKDELRGYREYAQHVRYRLVPFVW